MDQNVINKWALDIIKKTSCFWERLAINNEIIRENGFSVFFSPVYANPKLLIIGINPGGNFARDHHIFNKDQINNKLPIIHDYFLNDEDDYDLAKIMRYLFNFNISLLKKSVKFNYYYFRTPSENVLYKQREFPEIYKFCTEQTLNIIKVLNPEKIITEGLGVFDMLVKLLDFKKQEPIKESRLNKFRLIQRSSKNNIELIGLIHPSGSRTRLIFNENKTKIIEELKKSFM
ncbi:MAG: hypothetical protein JST15_00755 [Bacteroidetes bacterium]|nr:hypothetical protein [Bacteroidota bacterium]